MEVQLIQALEHMREMVVYYDTGFHIKWLNQAAIRWSGKTPTDVLGRRCYEVFYGQAAPCAGCVVHRVILTGMAVSTEHRTMDGRFWAVRAYPVHSDEGVLSGVMEISLDLSQVKAVLSALREQERRYTAVVQNIKDGICVVESDSWQILETNPAFVALVGSGSELPAGLTFLDLVMADRQSLHRQLSEAMRDNAGKMLETQLKALDGRILDVELTLNPLILQGKTAIVMVCRDVHERRAALTERLRAQKLESLAVMAQGIAHDFNNILSGVVGNLSLAKIDADPESRLYDRLCAAEKACSRAEEITRRLLSFADGGGLKRSSITTNNFITHHLMPALTALKVPIFTNLSHILPNLSIDAELLTQALVDLASDIFIHRGAKGIHLEVRSDSKDNLQGAVDTCRCPMVCIALSAPEVRFTLGELERLFDPYALRNFAVGKGLKVCGAYAVIRRHGGHILACSDEALGTRLVVRLPSEVPLTAAEDAVQGPHGVSRLYAGRILIMDDEQIVRETLGEILRLKGFDVTLAADGREAVELYGAHMINGERFDAVILDLTLRGGSGAVEVLQELKRLDPDVRAFVASGYAFDPVIVDYHRYGFCGVAIKPFEYDSLAVRIHQVIASKGA